MDRKRIVAALMGDHDRAELPRPMLTPRAWADIARRARDRAGRPRLTVSPVHLAVALGIPLSNKVPPNTREVTDGERIWFRPKADAREEAVPIWHGLGHVLYVLEGCSHNESDAWGLAGELAFPGELVRLVHDVTEALRVQRFAPGWFLAAQISFVLNRLRAA